MFDCISSHHSGAAMATEDDEDERAAAVAIKPQSVAILSQHSSLSTSYAATAATIITLGWEGSDAIMELVEEEESSKINRVHDDGR